MKNLKQLLIASAAVLVASNGQAVYEHKYRRSEKGKETQEEIKNIPAWVNEFQKTSQPAAGFAASGNYEKAFEQLQKLAGVTTNSAAANSQLNSISATITQLLTSDDWKNKNNDIIAKYIHTIINQFRFVVKLTWLQNKEKVGLGRVIIDINQSVLYKWLQDNGYTKRFRRPAQTGERRPVSHLGRRQGKGHHRRTAARPAETTTPSAEQ